MDVLKGNPANANIPATTTTTIATSLTTNTTTTITTASTSATTITTSTSTLTNNLIINNSIAPNNSITSTSTNANSNVPSNSLTTTITTTTTTTTSSSLPLPYNNATTLTGLTLANATALLQNLPPLDTGGIKQDDSNNVSLASGISEGQRSLSAAPSASSSPILSPTGKIFGRNANGTMVATSRPNNEAEVQLYRVLQRASLLAYYDTLLEMGGDDVQQLYEAGEEEFLEIMALVGMASKPLHVRRLQKALHEWANNPHQFQTPISNNAAQFDIPAKTTLIFNPDHLTFHCQPRPKFPTFNPSAAFNPTPLINTVPPSTSTHILSQICNLPTALPPQNASLILPPSPSQTLNTDRGHSLLSNPNNPATANAPSIGVAASNAAHQVTSSSPQLTPVLSEMQVARIALGAEKIAAQLPQREPRAHSSKKRTSRELEQIIAMNEYDPRRMEEIRKYSAIYGRFDCKRRPEKPLTLHEVCVNEAAAQLCRLVPALLTRRDELFPLARQIVKDAGFGHSASIARYGTILNQITQSVLTNTTTSTVVAATTTRSTGTIILDCESTDSNATAIKRQRLSSTDTGGNLTGSDNNRDLNEDCRYNLFAIYQKFAAKAPPFHLTDIAKFSLNKPSTSDCEEQDIESRFSFSNSCSSPPLTSTGLEDDSSPNILDKCCNRSELPTSSIDFFGNNHNCLGEDSCMSSSNISVHQTETNAKRKISLPLPLSGNGNKVSGEVQVVSASGNHIIAVANPALLMSPTLNESISLKRETDSADY